MWSISGLPMILSRWAPVEELEAIEVRNVPIWIIIKHVPRGLFHWKGISCLAKVVGKPIKLHPETIQCVKFDEAKILVEADLNVQLPKAHKFCSKSKGVFSVEFLYPWVPQRCTKCFQWGHKPDLCQEKNGKIHHTEQGEQIEEKKVDNNLDQEESLAVQVTSVSHSSLLTKRSLVGDSSKAVQGDSNGSRLEEKESQEKINELVDQSSGEKVNSYFRVMRQENTNGKDPLEELRKVKEGLRNISPYSSSNKVEEKDINGKGTQEYVGESNREDKKESHNIQRRINLEEKIEDSPQEESPNTQNNQEKKTEVEREEHSRMEGEDVGSCLRQIKGSPIKMQIRESPKENVWSTVSQGKSGKGKNIPQESISLSTSPSRYEILAESNEEMEMMISKEDLSQEDADSENQESDYEKKVEKAIKGRPKSKGGGGGRGRGRKSKKH